eukprot:TRINITY_DN6800_c0_g1_i1.p1 TRINITY_DN6800_c0_g1~~TRINITY_DN6800_c0_g1_i1.p1  ORF type:complete len:1355 (+),score=587.22 TRINITY_DN6800_c0_g1_i1:74-4138(+)
MSDSKKKQTNAKKAQMQKKPAADQKNNKNNIETSDYAADNDTTAATKNAASKSKNKNRSPKKIKEESSEELSTSSSEKQTSVASTSTSHNHNASHNTATHLESNGTHDQSEQERKKKKKKHKRSFGKWRPFQRQEVIDSDDSADSDEERSYIRSIRERVTLEEFERKATRELREKIEQARINRRFFLSTRRTPEQQAKHSKMQHLVGANLFNPPREYVVDERQLQDYDVTDKALHAEALRALTLEDEEQLVTFQHRAPECSDELAVPSYRDISTKYADSYLGYDPVQTDLYWSTYQAEYIVYDTDPIEMEVEPPLFQDKMPRRKHAEPSLRRASSAGVVSQDKVTRVSKFFHPHRWSKVELDWVRALLAVYGAEWPVIAKLMCRAKQPPALQSAYVRSGGVLDEHHVTVQSMEVVCGLCQQPRDNKRMVFCTCCDRAYHLKCLDPPMSRIPNEWFCSPMCASVIKMKCELCSSASDDDKMLLCDGCDRGYHMYCLPTPLTAVPEGDWFCPSCAQSRGLVAPQSSTKDESRVESHAVSTAPDSDTEARVVPLIPLKCVLTSTQHTTAPRSVIHKHWLLAQFSLLAESVPLCQQHHTPHSSQPWTPLKQPPVLALHESATQLLHSARVTYAQLRQLRQYCVTCLLHAAVELVPGASIDLSRIPVPERSIFTQRIRPTERTLDALRTHFTHHIHACVAAVDRVQRDAVKKTPKPHAHKLSKKQRRVSFAEEAPPTPVTPVKPAPTLKRRKSEGDAYKREYAHKKKRAPLDEYAELPSPSATRVRVKVPVVHQESNDGYEAGAPRYWVFQANPGYYDIQTSLKELSDMTWLVKQQTGKIHLGDKVFIWESGKQAGVLAVGSVMSEPALIDELAAMAKYAHTKDLGANKELRSHVHVDYVLPTRIDKATVRATPALAQMTILRAPIGTNFRITRDQAYHLERLVLARSEGAFTPLYDHSKDEEDKESDEDKQNGSNDSNNNNTATDVNNNNNTTVSEENNTNVRTSTEAKNSTENNVDNGSDVVMQDREEKVTPVKQVSAQAEDTDMSPAIDLNQGADSVSNNSSTHVNNENVNNSPPRNNNIEANNSSSPSRKRQHEVTAEDTSPNKRRRTLPRAATQRRVFNADDFLPDEAFTEEMMRDLERHATPVNKAPVTDTKTPVSDVKTPVKTPVTETPVIDTPITASLELTPVTQPLNGAQSLESDVDPRVACVICRSRATSVQVKHVTGPVTFPQELLKCHACQEQYHTHCVVPSRTELHSLALDTHHWLCPGCGLTRDELTRVRTALVLLELHYELRRMLREECEQIYFSMKQLINSASETNEVTSALQTRVTDLEQLTRDATGAATESYRAWHSHSSL